PPPHAGGSIKIEEHIASGPSRMLQHEVAIEQNGFHLSQKRIIAVDVCPASLDHADIFAGEMMNRALKKIRRRNEIGVEDGDKFSARGFHPFVKRSRL